MTRDRIIVFGILAVVVIAAISRHVVTSATLVLIAVAVPSIILHEVSHGAAALEIGRASCRERV